MEYKWLFQIFGHLLCNVFFCLSLFLILSCHATTAVALPPPHTHTQFSYFLMIMMRLCGMVAGSFHLFVRTFLVVFFFLLLLHFHFFSRFHSIGILNSRSFVFHLSVRVFFIYIRRGGRRMFLFVLCRTVR